MPNLTFPKDFKWGVACSAFQLEGGTYEGGKSENIREHGFRDPEQRSHFRDTRSPDVIADFYHKYPEDFALFQELGTNTFRFSIAWTRICPDISCKPNQAGIDYYNGMIDSMIEHGMTPFFDLWHSDLPQWVLDNGGSPSENFVKWFSSFAEICFREFGDRVKLWSTVNEPKLTVYGAYAHAHGAPYMYDLELALKATRNMILAHFECVKILRKLWPDAKIGSVHCTGSNYCMSFEPEDIAAAKRHEAAQLLFLEPMMLGKFPQELLDYPDFAKYIKPEYIQQVKENFVPMDFFGLNYYSSGCCRSGNDSAYGTAGIPTPWEKDAYGFTSYPAGLFDLLMTLNKRYNGTPMYVTENGYTYRREDVFNMDLTPFHHDDKRIAYIREHLRSCARAIQAGVNLKGYYYWSAMDCWESGLGYGFPMGLVGVNFDTLERVPRDSFYYYQKVIANNMVD